MSSVPLVKLAALVDALSAQRTSGSSYEWKNGVFGNGRSSKVGKAKTRMSRKTATDIGSGSGAAQGMKSLHSRSLSETKTSHLCRFGETRRTRWDLK